MQEQRLTDIYSSHFVRLTPEEHRPQFSKKKAPKTAIKIRTLP